MKLRLCEIVQQLDYFNVDNLDTVFKARTAIRDYAYIIHDRDVDNVGNAVKSHVHIAIRLKDSYDTKYIGEWFGVGEQYVGRVKGRWSDMLKYLTHENSPDKYQYSESDVVSNFDWVQVKNTLNGSERKSEIINGIVDGKIREYNYYEYVTIDEYTNYRRAIDDAYKYRADRLKGVDRNMECVFMTGGSGTGKTTQAKEIALAKGYSVFVSSGSNDVLDGYKGEDCIILDDLRPSSMGLSDLLKMLDNNTSSTVKSRYRNKVLECRLIIITTVLPLETFYRGVFESEEEPIVQFKRRCKTHMRFTNEHMYISYYNPKFSDYGKEYQFVNPCFARYDLKELSEAEELDAIASVLGGTLDLVKEIQESKGYDKVLPLDKFVR